MSEWISVNERMPTTCGFYLCALKRFWSSYDEKIVRSVVLGVNGWEPPKDYEVKTYVTHWMPLPDPPK